MGKKSVLNHTQVGEVVTVMDADLDTEAGL